MNTYTYPSNPTNPVTKDELLSALSVLVRLTITALWLLGLGVYSLGKACGHYYYNHEQVDAAFVDYTNTARDWVLSNAADLKAQVTYTVLCSAEVIGDVLIEYATAYNMPVPPQVVTTHKALCKLTTRAFYTVQRRTTESFGLRRMLTALRTNISDLIG